MGINAKHFLILILSARGVFSDEDSPQLKLNKTNEGADLSFDGSGEQAFSSSTISEKVPDVIGIPNQHNQNAQHHEKHRDAVDNAQPHARKPVYEIVNQPCYSPGCGGYGPQDGYKGNRWQQGRNRYEPHPKYVETRRRGGYGYREFYPPPPPPGYGPSYGPPYPDYGYGSRGGSLYPQDRYDRIGGYGRPPYDEYFLG